MDERQRLAIVQSVEQAMRSFEEAERSLDAERLIRHFASSPDFYIFNDGHRLTYDSMTAGVRSAFPTLQSIEGGFGDLDVIVLAADAALATAMFQETVTDRTGKQIRQHGAASWLWRKVDEQWLIAYGHVDHYVDRLQE